MKKTKFKFILTCSLLLAGAAGVAAFSDSNDVREAEAAGTYQKITSLDELTDGKYLIAVTTNHPVSNVSTTFVFNGVDGADGYVSGTVSGNTISVENAENYEMTIAAMTGGYSLQTSATNPNNKSKFIYGTSGSNKLNFGTSAKANEITFNNDGTATITGWKGTYNGEPSTEMIVPADSRIII